MMVRELTGGIYFGKRDRYQTEDRGEEATDLMAYSEHGDRAHRPPGL